MGVESEGMEERDEFFECEEPFLLCVFDEPVAQTRELVC